MSALAAARGVGELREVHLGMIDAVLAGGGIARVAQLAAEHLRGTVAIVLPSLDVDVAAPARRSAARPVVAVPVRSGDETLGRIELLDATPAADAREILELAALATLTAVTLRDAHVTQRRATAALLTEIVAGKPHAEVLREARPLGADLANGAAALVARPATDRMLALIGQELPGSLAAVRGDRAEALVPAHLDPLPLARRLNAGLSPAGHDFAAAAVRFATIAQTLDKDPADLRTGTWRMLIASDEPALQSLIEETIGPAGDLHETLRAYIDHGASVSATAAKVYAHRHTVSNRLERLRALTGHDPQTPTGLTQLALGLQALDVTIAGYGLR